MTRIMLDTPAVTLARTIPDNQPPGYRLVQAYRVMKKRTSLFSQGRDVYSVLGDKFNITSDQAREIISAHETARFQQRTR